MGYHGILWESMEKYGLNIKIRLYVDNFFILNKITEFCQMAYKPGSVSTKVVMIIHLGLMSP